MSAAAGPSPAELALGEEAAERFPALRDALDRAGADPFDRDAFLLVREVAQLLHDYRPEEGLGDAVAGLAGFIHHAYLYWMHGARVHEVGEAALRGVLSGPPAPGASGPARDALYVRLPQSRVWGNPREGSAPEPLDGWFVIRDRAGLRMLAVFGIRPGRAGFTAVPVGGPRPEELARADGTPLFAPLLEGGARAGLATVLGEEELLELGWRVEEAR